MTSLMVTSGGGYGVLVGNWLLLGYNPCGIPGICPSELPKNREGTRAGRWTDDHRQDSHSSVSPEDRDICTVGKWVVHILLERFLVRPIIKPHLQAV